MPRKDSFAVLMGPTRVKGMPAGDLPNDRNKSFNMNELNEQTSDQVPNGATKVANPGDFCLPIKGLLPMR